MNDQQLERLLAKSEQDAYFRGLEEAALQSQKEAASGKKKPREDDYPGTCDVCEKAMRPFTSDPEDYPAGTPRRARKGMCDSCDAAARRANKAIEGGTALTPRQQRALKPQHGKRKLEVPEKCVVCGLPMRPGKSRAEDYPAGTFRHAGRGRCEPCYRLELKEGGSQRSRQKRPERCQSCNVRLVAASTPAGMVPADASRYGGKGRCKSCYIRDLQGFSPAT